jgi:hypothetical protein
MATIRVYTRTTVANDNASGPQTKLNPVANSPRDSRRYNDQQVQAIMRAHIIDGHIVSDVWRMAIAGELGVPAFKPDRRYMYQLIKNNRDQFEASNPDALAASTTKALAMAHKANLDALRNLGPKTDPTKRALVAKAVADTARTLASLAPKTKPSDTRDNSTSETTSETPAHDPTLANLIAMAPKPATKASRDAANNSAPSNTSRGAETGSLSRARTDAPPSRAA